MSSESNPLKDRISKLSDEELLSMVTAVEAGSPGSPDTKVTAEAQTAKIFEWRQGFNARFLINLDVRLRLFRAFAQSPGARARYIARRLGLHLPYVEIWCTTAYNLGLLRNMQTTDTSGGSSPVIRLEVCLPKEGRCR